MKHFKKLGLGLLTLLAFTSLSLGLLVGFSQRAYAATGKWIDAGAIEVNGEIYIDGAIDEEMDYYLGGVDDDCSSVIREFSGGYWSANYSSATLITKVRDPFDARSCSETSESITLSDTNNARLWFTWIDAGEIEMLVESKRTYRALPGNAGTFVEVTDSDCRSSVVIADPVNNPGVGTMTIRLRLLGECIDANTVQVRLDPTNANLAAGTGASNSGNSMDDTCESRTPGWGWLLCSGIDLLDGALNFIDNQIQRLLEVNHDRYTNPGLRDAWGIFRNIAYIILIPIMLIMVIGTAIGVEAFSAYTVRKALPRMVIAIIFITLSWYICTFLIGFFNTMGSGVIGLATAPFRAQATDLACQSGNLNLSCLFSYSTDFSGIQAGSDTILRGLVNTVASAGLAIGVVVFVLFSFGTLLGGAILGLLVLFLREMFVLALILLAPLAILAWIFPGNDKLWQWWWGLFSKLLIMYPLIMGLIASGRIFAWIINVSPSVGGENIIQPILKLIAYIIPYALIPLTFKFAGGMFANIAGIVNDRERGLVDRWKNLRNAGLKKAHETIDSGTGRRTGEGATGPMARFGGAYRRVASGGRHGAWSRTEAGRARWEMYGRKQRDARSAKAAEEDAGWALNNDGMTKAVVKAGLAGGSKQDAINNYVRDEFASRIDGELDKEAARLGLGSRGELSANQRNAVSSRLQASLNAEAITGAEQLEQSTGLKIGTDAMTVLSQKFRTSGTNTAYGSKKEGAKALQEDLMALQAKGLISREDAATWVKSNRGRTDWSAAGFMEAADFATGKIKAEDYLKLAAAGADPREIFGAHTKAAETFSEVFAEESKVAQAELAEAMNRGDSEAKIIKLQAKADKAAANLEGAFQQMRYASPKKADYFADNVLSQPITYYVKEEEEVAVRDASGNPQFKNGKPVTKKTGKYVWRQKQGTHRQMLEDTKKRVLSEGTKIDGEDVYGIDSRMADRGQGGWSTRMEGESAEDARYREEMERRAREEE